MILLLFFLMSNVLLITNVKSDDNDDINTVKQKSIQCLDTSYCVPILIIIFGSIFLVILTYLINMCIIIYKIKKIKKIKQNETKPIEYNIYSEI